MPGISVLEAMSATGLRAVRYAKEVAGIGQIVANDLDSGAVQSMRRNIEFNGVGDKVTPSEADARLVMLQHSQVRPSQNPPRSPPCDASRSLVQTPRNASRTLERTC